MSKWLSKCIAAFDYFDKALIVLSAEIGGISIIPFSSIIEASVGITSACGIPNLLFELYKTY